MSRSRFVALAATLGLAVGVMLTWPLARHLRTAVLDDGTFDAFQFTWNVWWVRESLLGLLRHPFSTHHLYYPDGVPLLFHTGSFSLGLASLPIQLLAGPLVAHNVLVVTAPALLFLAVALLAREATGDPWAALVAAFLGTVTPFAMWVLPVIYLSAGWIPPALLFVWWVAQRRRQWTLIGVALALLVFSVFASQEYAMLSVALLLLDAALRLLLARRFHLPPLWVRGTLVFFGLAGLFLGGLAAIALANPAQPPRSDQALLGSGFIAGFFVPRWLKEPPLRFGLVYYLGTMTMALGLAGLWMAPRRAAYWALAALPLLGMVMGPYLHVQHPFFSLPKGGGTMPESGIPGPYLIFGKVFPLLKFLRAPYRWMTAVNPVLAVLAGVGVAALRAHRAGSARAALTAALLALAVAVPAFETRGIRAPLKPAAVPSAYDVVANDPEEAALLDLPSGYTAGGWALLSSRYMYYQTKHGKFLLEGTVSRLPPGRRLFLARRVTDFATLPYLKYVAVHRDLLSNAGEASQRQTADLVELAQRQGRLVAQDATTDIYQLDTFRPETVWSPRHRRTNAPASDPRSADQ